MKGKTKKKSIKAASHSGMGSKRKLSRMGKRQKKHNAGVEATFIGRSAAVKKLQVTLKDFRRLCILKGVFPREPRGRTPGNKKGQVYYHVKDLQSLAHEPLLDQFRQFKAFMKKVRRAAGRNEKDEAQRLEANKPTYTLHHIVKERYPRFIDALADLDDALALTYLFAALPSDGRITTKVTSKAQELSAAWSAYCTTTSSITKTFISVKGVYFEAQVHQTTIRWVVPHSFTQNLPKDVDYRVMLTFFEFYETFLGFVLYKLYNDIGVRYPLVTSASINENCNKNHSSLVVSHLHALSREARASKSITSIVSDAAEKDSISAVKSSIANQTKRRKKDAVISIDAALSKLADDFSSDGDEENEEEVGSDEENSGDVDVAGPLKAALDNLAMEQEAAVGCITTTSTNSINQLSEEAIKRKRLFSGLVFFLSREVPRGYLELVCLSYGGSVGWEGDDSPIGIRDKSITHHVVDRNKLLESPSLPTNREYIQPQWLVDCANFHFLLPCSRYGIGMELPPHLSPFVDDEEEGYKPAYAEEIERLKNGEEICDFEDDVSTSSAHKEVKISEEPLKKQSDDEDMDDKDGESEDDEDVEEVDRQVVDVKMKTKQEGDDEAKELAKLMMSKKAARLYGRMQHGLSQKQAKVADLQRKRKEIEVSKSEELQKKRKEIKGTRGKTADGKSKNQAKVERLKEERKSIEKEYSRTNGSMKKNRKNA